MRYFCYYCTKKLSFHAEYIRHGRPTTPLLGLSTLLRWNLENCVPQLLFPGKTVVIIGILLSAKQPITFPTWHCSRAFSEVVLLKYFVQRTVLLFCSGRFCLSFSPHCTGTWYFRLVYIGIDLWCLVKLNSPNLTVTTSEHNTSTKPVYNYVLCVWIMVTVKHAPVKSTNRLLEVLNIQES